MTPAPPSGSPRLLAVALGGLVALAAAMGIGRFIYTPILPPMVEALGLSQSQAGFIASANFAGYLAGALLAVTPAFHGSRRAWFLGALGLSAVTTGAMALASTLPGFVVLRFAGGVASAFVLVFGSALVLERVSLAGRGRLFGVHFAGVGTGIALSALICTDVIASKFGWRGLWAAGGLVSLAAVAAAAALIPDRPDAPQPEAAGSGRVNRPLVALVAAYGLFGFGYVITATFLVAIVRASPASVALEPLVWLAVGAAAIPSAAIWAWVGERIGMVGAFALACGIEAFGVGASVVSQSTAALFVAAILLGGTFVGITALGLMAARSLSRGDPRRAMAVMTAAFSLGQIVGPAFAGLVHDAVGSFRPPSLAAAAALLAAALLAALVARPGGAGRRLS